MTRLVEISLIGNFEYQPFDNYCLMSKKLLRFPAKTESGDYYQWTMMERLSTLGTESVIIVTLMASTSVLLFGKYIHTYAM